MKRTSILFFAVVVFLLAGCNEAPKFEEITSSNDCLPSGSHTSTLVRGETMTVVIDYTFFHPVCSGSGTLDQEYDVWLANSSGTLLEEIDPSGTHFTVGRDISFSESFTVSSSYATGSYKLVIDFLTDNITKELAVSIINPTYTFNFDGSDEKSFSTSHWQASISTDESVTGSSSLKLGKLGLSESEKIMDISSGDQIELTWKHHVTNGPLGRDAELEVTIFVIDGGGVERQIGFDDYTTPNNQWTSSYITLTRTSSYSGELYIRLRQSKNKNKTFAYVDDMTIEIDI